MTITAKYENGVFRPLEDVVIREGTVVEVHVPAELPAERPRRRLSLEPPLVPANGRQPLDLTNEQIYDLIEFP